MMKAFTNKLRKKRSHSLGRVPEKRVKKFTKDKNDHFKKKSDDNENAVRSDTSASSTPTGTPRGRRGFLIGKGLSGSPHSIKKSSSSSSITATSSPINSSKLLRTDKEDKTSPFIEGSTTSLPSSQSQSTPGKQMTLPDSTNSFSDYLSSLPHDNMTDSFRSLSIDSSAKPSTLSSSRTSNQCGLSLTEDDLSRLQSIYESSLSKTASSTKVWGKRFKLPFRGKEKPGKDQKKRRVSNADAFAAPEMPKQLRGRSQSLCVGTLGDAAEMLEKFQEDNEALEIEVRGKDEELRLLNATIDQVNQTWEEKIKAMMKDLENTKRKNEQLRNVLSKDSVAALASLHKPVIRVPVSAQMRSSRLADVPESNQENSSNDTENSRRPCGAPLSPPAKRKGVREISKRQGVSVRPSAKTDDIREKLRAALTSSKCLSKLSREEINDIVDIMKCKRINKGERLMQEGHAGQAFYVLADGMCKIYKQSNGLSSPNLSDTGRPVAQWEIFGEADVFYHTRRVWSCKCIRPGSVWYITKDEFKSAVMQQDIRRRKREIHEFLKNIKRFEMLCTNQLRMLTTVSKIAQYADGDYIIRQGSLSKCVYIVKEGEVTITKVVDGTEMIQTVMRMGELFGENENVDSSKVNAVASGKEIVQCILIPLKSFNRVRECVLEPSDKITASNITKSLVERKMEDDGQESNSSSRTADTSSGYASDTNPSENKRKTKNRKRYNANHSETFWKRLNQLKGVDEHSFDFVATIGNGAFGSVDLVSLKFDSQDVVAVKKLSKREIIALDQHHNVKSEKNLQMATSRDCPFIVPLYGAFKDHKYVYFVMEYCAGGELFSLLTHAVSFDDATARFYTSCVLEALIFLHSKHIIFRDLKPENVVIDKYGYCKLTDFGFAKKVSVSSSQRTYTYCGTPEYMAPEVLLHHAQSFAVDLWALGIFIFELLDGKAPFRNKNRSTLAESILRGIEPKLKIAREAKRISTTASNLIKELCQSQPEDRLGSSKHGIPDVAKHFWFYKMDWEALRQRQLHPPWIPKLDNVLDLRYFETHSKLSCNYDHQTPFSGWDENFRL